MPKKPTSKSVKKELVPPPTKKEITSASKDLRKGHSDGGRVMNQQAQAKKQGIAKRASSKTRR